MRVGAAARVDVVHESLIRHGAAARAVVVLRERGSTLVQRTVEIERNYLHCPPNMPIFVPGRSWAVPVSCDDTR